METLAGIKALGGLSLRQLRVLADRIVVHPFKRHAIIYDERQPTDYMYVLLSGIARLTCLNRKGERILLEVLGPGDFVAIPPLLTDTRSHLQFGAFTECRIGLLKPKKLVQDIVGLQFGPFRQALTLTSGRWWQLLVRHSAFIEQSLRERVLLALLDLGAKVGIQDGRKKTLSIDLTHQDLADLVRGSRAKVTTCLRQLAAQDAITQEGRTRIVIVPEKLHAIAAGF